MFRRLASFFALGWRLLRAPILLACGVLAGFLVPYTISLDHQLRERFDDLSWQIPSRVLARPLDLAPGRAMNADTLLLELDAARYRNDGTGRVPGSFARNGNHFEIARRAFAGLDGRYPAQRLGVDLQDGRISRLVDLQTGAALHQAELDPARIATLYGLQQEERRLVQLEQLPGLLVGGLQAVEDTMETVQMAYSNIL